MLLDFTSVTDYNFCDIFGVNICHMVSLYSRVLGNAESGVFLRQLLVL